MQEYTILVTGGAGMIGSRLVRCLVERGENVSVVDNLWRGRLDNLIDNGDEIIPLNDKFMNLDLRAYENCLLATKGVDIVYHLADVVAGINYVFGNELSVFQDNIVMNSNMLKASVENGVSKYIYVGTACSYPKELQSVINVKPLKEEQAYPANPESSYGWCKLMGEYECQLAYDSDLIDIGLLRLHNVYGPNCDMSPERSQVIPSLIRKVIKYPDEEFIIWGSGKQRRAFVYVDDVVNAMIAVLEKGMGKGVIQIGPEYSTSISEIAEKIIEISGKDINLKYDTSQLEGDFDRAADWSRASEILAWKPGYTIHDGLSSTYNWCKKKLETA